MNTNVLPTKQELEQSHFKQVSWRAVFCGAVIALGLTFLFNLLTVSVGLSLYTKNDTGQMILGFVGFAWMMVGGYVLLFLAGWVTGKLSHFEGNHRCMYGTIVGFIMWSTYLLLSLLIVALVNKPFVMDVIGSFSAILHTHNEKVPTAVGLTGLGTFIIFLMGAIGACAGTCFGLKRH